MRDRGATIVLLLVFSLVLSTLSFPLVSATSELWSQTYGGTRSDSAEAMVQTSDGGFALAGYTTSFGAGDSDFWLVKTDSNGNMQWNKTYGGAKSDIAYSLIETSDGGYALAGSTRSVDAGPYHYDVGDYNVWLVKTDKYGYVEWNRTYGGANDDIAYSLVEPSDGGYALAGETYSFDVGLGDFWLVKTDAYGNMEWNQTYGGADSEIVRSLVEVSGGGFALAGYTDSLGAGDSDFWLVKTDEYGIPEFPSWTPLLITLVAVVAVTVIYRRKLSKSNKRGGNQ